MLNSLKLIEKKISEDYHLIYPIESGVEKIEFECYNSPHTDIEFEELKQNCIQVLKENKKIINGK